VKIRKRRGIHTYPHGEPFRAVLTIMNGVLMWNKLIIHPSRGCLKDCPFCYLRGKDSGDDQPIEFFQDILKQARDFPEWVFSVDLLPPGLAQDIPKLIHEAWKLDHPYAIATNYENLMALDPTLFEKSRKVCISLDEFKLVENDYPIFYQTLTWALRRKIPVEVEVALTPIMIEKLLSRLILDRLVDLVKKVRFYVPKSHAFTYLTREEFGEFLDYICQKLLSSRYAEKVEIDECLLPVMTPWRPLVNPDCPNQSTLVVMPDGGLRLCPFGRDLTILQDPLHFLGFIRRDWTADDFEEFRYCHWRECMKTQEESASSPGREA
jgi:hypothetical protein